ncbi:MAG: peptide deformylase [Bacillota bacterium]
MAIRTIIKEDDETIRKQSRIIENFDEKLVTLVSDMKETMDKANGVGIAAVQVGILRRVFVIDIDGNMQEFINPTLHDFSQETQTGQEGCLSCPGKYGDVTRPMKVSVTAQNLKGETFTMALEGLYARCACHEFDHLSGGLFIDKVEGELYD